LLAAMEPWQRVVGTIVLREAQLVDVGVEEGADLAPVADGSDGRPTN
jgi:hypothetical protein